MAGNLITSYPVFESGQLLTSSQLNDTRLYLDENLRANRSLLNGVGVVSGLEITYQADEDADEYTITLSRGLAITTDGYLIPFTQDYTFHSAKNYYEFEGDPLNPVYPQFFHPVTNLPFDDMRELALEAGLDRLNDSGVDEFSSRVVVLL